ncbi:MAG: hypothetical protein EOP49_09385 [Sphingobacteriales bacterium]|nr:MAG: hypothetical protein EOP49_09385 [Sphingobacteriales bacterium]
MRYPRLFTILACLGWLQSCDRPECRNTNPIFTQFAPETKEYKTELAKRLRAENPEHLRYWFDKEIPGKAVETYELFVQGDSLCAKIIVDNKSDKTGLGKIGGYSGAELKGAVIRENEDNPSEPFFILEQVTEVID